MKDLLERESASAWVNASAVLIVILPLLCAPVVRAQSSSVSRRIEGKVVDRNNSPVSGAEVKLQVGSTQMHQTTGDMGEFHFDGVSAGTVKLSVDAKGFGSVERQLSDSDAGTLTIVLQPAGASEEITVTAARTETRVGDTPASVVVLSTADLGTAAAVTLDDKLRQVPGFSLFRRSGSRTANPTSQGVSLRGVGASGASRAVILADGIPLNDPFGGWVYWGRVPREALDRIEVVQGGQSNLYGSDALGGVINLIDRTSREDTISLETSFGNEVTPEGSFFAGGRARGWGAKLGVEGFHTDGYLLVDDEDRGLVDTRAASEYSTVDLTIEKFIADRGRIFINGSTFQEARHNGTPIQKNRTHIRMLTAGADYQSSQLGSFALRVYGGSQVFDQDFSSIAADRNSETITRSQRVPAGQTGFSLQWSRQAGSRQTLVAGVDGRDVHGASDEIAFIAGKATSAVDAGGRQRDIGLFAQDMIQITPRWLVTLGVRGDRWRHFEALGTTKTFATGARVVTLFPERTESAFNPRASVMYRASENLSLYVAGYRAFRAPTLNELYRSFRVGNVLTLANDQLQAERLSGGEAGANVNAFSRKLDIRGTFFWSELTRPIANVTLQTTPALITRQRQNLGRTRSRGIEIESSARVTDTISICAGYQFVDATVLRFPANVALEGLLIPQVPRHIFTFQTRYSNPRFLTVAFQGRASSEQFDDDQNLLPLAPYFTLDAFISRRLSKEVEVFGAFENMTGQRYEIGKTPVTTFGPPFLARAGLRFTLGGR